MGAQVPAAGRRENIMSMLGTEALLVNRPIYQWPFLAANALRSAVGGGSFKAIPHKRQCERDRKEIAA